MEHEIMKDPGSGPEEIFETMDYQNFQADLDELETLSHYGPALILFIGEQGSGKTTLIEELIQAGSEINVIQIDGSLNLSMEEIFASILQQIKAFDSLIDFENTKAALCNAAENQDQLIIVDDGQMLPQDIVVTLLRLISPITANPALPLRLLMTGNPLLTDQIMESGLVTQEGFIEIHQKGLREQEFVDFLALKLKIPPSEIEENFTPKKIKSLWKASFGNPGHIIKMLHHDEPQELQESESKNYLWLRIILGIIGVGFLWLALFGGDWFEKETLKVVPIPIQNTKPAKEKIKPLPNQTMQPAVTEKISDTADKATEFMEKELPEKPVVVPDQEDGDKTKLVENVNPAFDETKHEEKNGALKISPIVSTKDLSLPESSAPVKDNRERANDRDSGNSISTSEPLQNAQDKVIKSNSTSATSELEIKAKLLSKDEEDILALQKSHYMIQFVGLSTQRDIDQFIDKHKFPMTPKVYRSLLNNKPWFILVGGDYSNMDLARAARNKLSASLKKEKPWIKSVKIIHQQIEKYQSKK